MAQISCPEFTNLDREIIGDFRSCLKENIEEIEFGIYKLDQNEDPDLVDELFRAMHSLKGNCRMVLLLPFVYTTHELEELVSEMRAGERHYHHFYGSIFIAVITIIEKLINELIATGECSKSVIERLDIKIKELRQAKPSQGDDDIAIAEDVLSDLIKLQESSLTSEVDEANIDPASAPQQVQKDLEHHAIKADSSQQQENMAFFRMLAEQQDGLSVYRNGRTEEILKLCQALNQRLKTPIDNDQLAAAVYLHDFGMLFVPAGILSKQESLSKEEVLLIRKHIVSGSRLLLNLNGWQLASQIVLQHHERFDGKGYPKGISGSAIHPGAVFLALADTYCAITNERSDRSYKKSLFSAVSLINNESGKQFSPQWVEDFNDVIRKLYINPASKG